jgi:hypothetical protein
MSDQPKHETPARLGSLDCSAALHEEVGRAAYEESLKKRPLYHDGTLRKTWQQLDSLSKWSWSRESYTPDGRIL